MRNLTSEMISGLEENCQPIILGVFEFDSGTVGMFTGIGTIEWNGITFYGGGNLIGFSKISETQDLQAKNLILSLNSVDTSLVTVALSENVRNRPFRLYLALVDPDGPDSNGNIFIDDPYRIFSGLMDTFEITDDGKSATISLSIENILLLGQRSKISRYTDEEQRKKHPSDKGFEFINRLQDREISW